MLYNPIKWLRDREDDYDAAVGDYTICACGLRMKATIRDGRWMFYCPDCKEGRA